MLLVCGAMVCAASHAQVPAKVEERALQVKTLQRYYAAYVPAANRPGKPLLIQ
jgi:poly(3-hydroxybutyrate) depolymerase